MRTLLSVSLVLLASCYVDVETDASDGGEDDGGFVCPFHEYRGAHCWCTDNTREDCRVYSAQSG